MSRISTGQADRRVNRSPAMPRVEAAARPEPAPHDEVSPVPVANRMRMIFFLALGLWVVIGSIVVAIVA
jgi:hypothetical protein